MQLANLCAAMLCIHATECVRLATLRYCYRGRPPTEHRMLTRSRDPEDAEDHGKELDVGVLRQQEEGG